MKTTRTIFNTLFSALALTVCLVSCNPSDEEIDKYEGGYYVSIATVAESADGKNYFKEDDGTTIYPTNLQSIPDSLVDSIVGKRSWFEHRILKPEFAESGYDKTAELISFYPNVWIKSCKAANSSEELIAFGEELIDVKYAWISGKYLNLGYQFFAADFEKHDFELVHKTYDTKDGKIHFELCHSESDKDSSSTYFTFSSFDVSDFLPTDSKEVVFSISYQNSLNTVKTFDVEINKDNDNTKMMSFQ